MKTPIYRSWRGGSDHAYHDQVGDRSGEDRSGDRPEGARALFVQVQPSGLHAASTLRPAGASAILQSRLPKDQPDGRRVERSAGGLGPGEGASLDRSAEGSSAPPKKGGFDRLLDAVGERAHGCGLIEEKPKGAIDSTGFEIRHASLHYLNKRPDTKRFLSPYWPKLTVLCHIRSYLWLAAQAGQGPDN